MKNHTCNALQLCSESRSLRLRKCVNYLKLFSKKYWFKYEEKKKTHKWTKNKEVPANTQLLAEKLLFLKHRSENSNNISIKIELGLTKPSSYNSENYSEKLQWAP